MLIVHASQFLALLGIFWHSYLEKTDNWRQIYKQMNSTFNSSNEECFKNNRWWRSKILTLTFLPIRIMDYGLVTIYTLSQYPGWIHPGTFPGENDAYKISPPWKRFEFSTSPVCIGNLSLPERNCELLMFPSEFLKFWYFAGDIAQKVFGSWLTSVSFKIYSGYK